MIIVQEAKHSRVYLTLYTHCCEFSEVYLKFGLATSLSELSNGTASDQEVFHDCSLRGGGRIILEWINNVASA